MKLFLPALFLAAAVLAGCGGPMEQKSVPAQSVPAMSAAIPAEKESTLTLYLPDEDGMHVTRRDFLVRAKEKTLKNALFQMIQLDRKQPHPLLPTGLSVKDVTVKDGTATINFSKQLKDLSGGSTTESLFIAMTVNTATEFPNVRQILFQMEGAPIKRLTGHFDMTQPFRRDESLIRMEKK